MTRTFVALLALTLAALVAAQAAVAKEGAKFMSYPTSTDTGSTWKAEFEAFAHGGAKVAPAVVIRNENGRTLRFAAERVPGTATPAGAALYRADVVFPAAGVWRYGVELRPGARPQWFEDGEITIAPAPDSSPAESGGGLDVPLWLLPLATGLLLAGIAAYFGRRALRAPTRTALR